MGRGGEKDGNGAYHIYVRIEGINDGRNWSHSKDRIMENQYCIVR